MNASIKFDVWETGGGCRALGLHITADRYLMLTVYAGASIPGDADESMVGLFSPEHLDADEPFLCWKFARGDVARKFALKLAGVLAESITNSPAGTLAAWSLIGTKIAREHGGEEIQI